VCRKCRKESDDLEAILAGAEAVRDEIDAAAAGVDWDGLSNRSAAAGLAEKRERDARAAARRPARLRPFSWRPLLAGAAAGLTIGIVVTALVLRRGPAADPSLLAASAPAGPSYRAPGEFLQRVELEMAKREAIGYLEQSEYLLLDVLERKPAAGPARTPVPAADATRTTEAARDLLARKRYLNAHLDDARIAKARALCDQIEVLLLELAQTSRELAPAEAAGLRRAVEDKQLLLQIRLLKRELRASEV